MTGANSSWYVTCLPNAPNGAVSLGTLAKNGSVTPAALAAALTLADFSPCAIDFGPSRATHSPAYGPDSLASSATLRAARSRAVPNSQPFRLLFNRQTDPLVLCNKRYKRRKIP